MPYDMGMQKNVLISIAIISLASFVFWYAVHNLGQQIIIPSHVQTVSEKKQGPLLNNKTPLYDVSYEVPVGLPGADILLKEEQQNILSYTNYSSADLAKKVADYNTEGVPSGDQFSDVITVAGLSSNRHYITYAIASYVYEAGAVHENHLLVYRTFDKSGHEYYFSDMFPNPASALDALSVASRESLGANSTKEDYTFDLSDDWFVEGTAPEATNFHPAEETQGSFVAPLADGLHVYFNEYQIAPYVAGPFEITLPYRKYGLTSVLDKKFIQ